MNGEYKITLSSSRAVLTYVGGIAAAFIFTFIISFMPDGEVKTWLGYVCTQAGFLVAVATLRYFMRDEFAATIPVKRGVSPVALLMTIPVTIGVFMQNTLFAVCFNKLLEILGVFSSVDLPDPALPVNAVLGLLCVCVAPALGEELMFRGVILGSYRDRGGVKAVLLSAIIFALGHFNLAQFVHQFILGAILAYIVLSTDNLWYAAAVHFLNNVLALFLGLVPGYNSLAVLDGKSAAILVAMCVAGAAILYPSLYGLLKLAGRKELNPKERWFFFIFCKKAVVKDNNIWYHNTDHDDAAGATPDKSGAYRKVFSRDIWTIALIAVLISVAVVSAILDAAGAA